MKDIIIRRATINDLKTIQSLNYELFKLETENFDPTLIVDWPLSEEGNKYFEELIRDEYVIVAIIENNIVGYLAGTINDKGSYESIQYGEINNMLIDKKYRRYGIGRKLINQFKEFCKNNNINNLKVVASAKNLNALSFYRKQGFEDFDIVLTVNMKENKNEQ